MALAVCLLFDPRTEDVIRGLWRRLEEQGMTTLLSHTHGRHVPHLTYASLRQYDAEAVHSSLGRLPARGPLAVRLDALGVFRRSRCWLAPAIPVDLAERQAAVVEAVTAAGADLHKHYRPGAWTPHVTLAPRSHLRDLAAVAACVNDVLPVVGTTTRAVLIDTSTGERRSLPHLL
jgi:2'-5' RNA ligase